MDNYSEQKKPRYNLNFVLQETGLKADTLRAWERRYNLPEPQRSPGGHRLFSEYDIQTIYWLLEKQKEGLSISKAVRLWREFESNGQDPLIEGPVIGQNPLYTFETDQQGLISLREKWIEACRLFDEAQAEQILSQAFALFPMQIVCFEIISKGIRTIGDNWYKGTATVQQEHFATEIAMRRIQTLIQAAPSAHKKNTIMVGCPPGDTHTLPALLISLLLRYNGWPVIYLGADIPESNLIRTIRSTKADLVILSASRLVSAASLQQIALRLLQHEIPVAFGGWVFEQNPDLVQFISGSYLGNNLDEVIPRIENLFHKPRTTETENYPGLYRDVLAVFKKHQNMITAQTLEGLQKAPLQMSEPAILQAHHNFMADIQAALFFGNLQLAEANLQWIHGLINNYAVNTPSLAHYLSLLHASITRVMGKEGQIITEWLSSTPALLNITGDLSDEKHH